MRARFWSTVTKLLGEAYWWAAARERSSRGKDARALLCVSREAGGVVTKLHGTELDFKLRYSGTDAA